MQINLNTIYADADTDFVSESCSCAVRNVIIETLLKENIIKFEDNGKKYDPIFGFLVVWLHMYTTGKK